MDIAEGYAIIAGLRTHIAALTGVALYDGGLSQAYRLLVLTDTGTLGTLTDTDYLPPTYMPLAYYTSALGTAQVFDARVNLAANCDRRIDLIVDGSGSGQEAGAHFSSLADAVYFVNMVAMYTNSTGALRTYRIQVRGWTGESATIYLAADNVIIEGVKGSSAFTGVTWDGDFPLLNINGHHNVILRDLTLSYTGSTTLTGIARVAITGSMSGRVLLDNVDIIGNGKLHGYIYGDTTHACQGLRVRSCRFTGATEFGVLLQNVEDCIFNDVYVEGVNDNGVAHSTTQGGLPAGGGTTGTLGGVILGTNQVGGSVGTGMRLTDVVVRGWANRGIYVGGSNARLRGCEVWDLRQNNGTDTAAIIYENVNSLYGIEVRADVSWVTECYVQKDQVVGDGVVSAYGIIVDALRVTLRDCNADAWRGSIHNYGIYLTDSANYCIVDGCQTNQKTLVDDSGHSNSIGANNRDD